VYLEADGGALVLFERTHVVLFLFEGLEATVADLRGGIDEFELDLLEILSLVVHVHWSSQADGALADTHAGALDHEEVVLDLAVMREAANWVDRFDGDVGGGGTIVHVDLAVLGLVAGTNSVDLLVDLHTVMVTLLTSTSNSVADSRRMPRTNTGDLSETSMCLSRQLLGSPSAGHTLSSVTLGDTNGVKVVVLCEHVTDTDLLLEQASGKVDLGSAVATVDLELDDMSLLLFERQKFHLGVGDKSYNLAVLFDLTEGSLLALFVVGPFLLVLGESLLLGLAPVLVESSLGLVGDVLGPDGLEGSEASRGLDVADNTDADHWRGLDDGDWLDDLFLVELGALSSDLTDDVGHTGFVADEASQVAFVAGLVLRVGLESAEMSTASLSGKESLRTVSGCFEFSMRHICKFDLRL